MSAWILALRPKTLTAAFAPVLVASLIAYKQFPQDFEWIYSFLALMTAVFVQIATNFSNDALDFIKGADTETRIGPQRVTQSGLISAKNVLRAAYLCFFLSFLCALPLILKGGTLILVLGIVSLVTGYAYTGGPFPLAYKGLGDLFVFLFFGWVASLGLYYVQTMSLTQEIWIAASQVGLLCTVLIVVNNLRDIDGDRKVNKKTLAVRLGKKFSKLEIYTLYILNYLLHFYWLAAGYIWSFLLPLLAAPLAILVCYKIAKTEPSPIYNQYLAQTAAVHMLFSLLLSIGFYLDGN